MLTGNFNFGILPLKKIHHLTLQATFLVIYCTYWNYYLKFPRTLVLFIFVSLFIYSIYRLITQLICKTLHYREFRLLWNWSNIKYMHFKTGPIPKHSKWLIPELESSISGVSNLWRPLLYIAWSTFSGFRT